MEEALLEETREVVEIQKLNTHTNISKNNNFNILALTQNHATIMINPHTCERVKESGLIYDGVIFSAATFAATAAVNEKNMFLIGVDIDFLNPVKEHEEEIIFEADVQTSGSGKKIVKVKAKIHDIVFMSGDFILLKLDEKSLIK